MADKIRIDLGNERSRDGVLIALSAMLALAALAMAINNILLGYQNINTVIIAEFLTSGIFAYVAYKTVKRQKKPWFAALISYAYGGLISLALYTFPAGSTVIQWWYAFPVLSLFLLSRLHGTAVSIVMLAVATSLSIDNNITVFDRAWNAGLPNLILPYLIILGLASVYEKVRVQNERQLTEFALTDPLTKCYNRLALKSSFSHFQSLDTQYSILLLDIDNFKSINDTYGHEGGDHILIKISQLFSKFFPHKNIFRIGGEEFLLIIEGEKTDSVEKAQTLRKNIADCNFSYQGKSIHITISAGLVSDIKNRSLSNLLMAADRLLYQGKAQGKNCIIQ